MATTNTPDLGTVTVTATASRFSISRFRAKLGVIARPNYFLCKLSGYKDLLKMNIDETFSWRCERAELPGRTIATTDDGGGGGTSLKLPYDVTFADTSISVICSEDMRERVFFENWMDLIVTPAGYDTATTAYQAGLVRYHNEYARGIKLEVSQLNSSGKRILTYTLHDIFPTAITPMTATWEEVNSYQRFGVTLTYRYYTFDTPNEF
jgi:hypothetical protein